MDSPGERSRHGLIIIHTGDGKGKTTAALGLAMRAVGHGLRVLVIQFIKANTRTGEYVAAERLAPELTIRTMGSGFVIGEWSAEDIAAAREAWEAATHAITCGEFDMVILDEVTYPVSAGVLPVGDVIEALAQRPPELHVVLTGRGAPAEIIEIADLVTEMSLVKHPYDAGIKGQRGIEF